LRGKEQQHAATATPTTGVREEDAGVREEGAGVREEDAGGLA
jgi:hypothetical protein